MTIRARNAGSARVWIVSAIGGAAIAVALVFWFGSRREPAPAPPPAAAPTPRFADAARYPRTAAEFEELYAKVTNWGRWGADDELGAANLITDAKRREAASLVRIGKVVSLSRTLLTAKSQDTKGDPFDGNGPPIEHVMNPGFATDTYKMDYHTYLHTHLDALCHSFHKGKVYNGYASAEVNTPDGCKKLGVQNLRNGLVTRGVLIDLPRLKNVEYLEPGTPIFTEDLDAWEKQTGVRIAPGDAVFIRTGRWAKWAKEGAWPVSREEAGLHASTAPWLKQRDIAIIGSDSGLEVLPTLVEPLGDDPMHILMLNAMGVVILDNHDLEALATTAAELKRWEFMVSVAPLVVTGGTGSPVNTLAIF